MSHGEFVARGDTEDRIYETAEDYIHGEYGGEIPIIQGIIKRHISSGMGIVTSIDKMALEIVGYYTGCLTPSGLPRVGRRRRVRQDCTCQCPICTASPAPSHNQAGHCFIGACQG